MNTNDPPLDYLKLIAGPVKPSRRRSWKVRAARRALRWAKRITRLRRK